MTGQNRIREWRERRELSQEALAEKAGFSVAYLSRMERGQRNVSLINLEKLARALDVKQQELVADEGPVNGGEPSSAAAPLLYRSQLGDKDCIQVSIGDLRKAAVRALRRGDVPENIARSAANVLVATLSSHPNASAVLRLAAQSRKSAVSPAPALARPA